VQRVAIEVAVGPMTDQPDQQLPADPDQEPEPAAVDRSAPAEHEDEAPPAQAAPPVDTGPGKKRGRWRAIVTVPLLVISCLFLMVAVVVDWAHYTVINTNGFVNTVGPVIESDAVTANFASRISDQVVSNLNLEARVHSALPNVAKPLAAPLTSAVSGYVEQAFTNVLRSPRLHDLWYSILRFTHSQVIGALQGDSQVISTTGGAVVLNLLPFVNQALESVQSSTSGLLGHNVKFPTITSETLPENARAELSKALGVNLPSDFGQITLFRSSRITTVKRGVTLFNVLAWLLPLLAALALLAALWLSRRRRRTLLQFLFLAAILIVLLRRFVFLLQRDLINSAQPANQPAASDIIHQLTGNLVDVTTWILGGLALAIVIALVTGPYGWATSLRGHMRRAWAETAEIAAALFGRSREGTTGVWVAQHRAALQIGTAAVAVLLMLVIDWPWTLIVLLLLAVIELALWRLRRGEQASLVEAKG
jgi:hypothetical protein